MDEVFNDYFKANTLTADFFRLVAGDYLGGGMSRQVYECRLDPTLVIKFETDSFRFQNVMEWQVWDRVRWVDGVKNWFCPLVSISPCGTILLQKKAQDLRDKELPKRVPAFFTDFKKENWGMYQGRPVIRDFGTHLLMENGMTKRMKRPEWHIK